MRHEHLVQLRWSDPDSLGHVNHARALSLVEDARFAMADGLPGRGMILARLEVDYLRQLYYRRGERLTVSSWVTRLGTKSLTVRQDFELRHVDVGSGVVLQVRTGGRRRRS